MINYIVISLTGSGKLMSAGNTKHISIPTKLVLDSSFPFETGEKVEIAIDVDNKSLIVEEMMGSRK